jgi:hypothetical protein
MLHYSRSLPAFIGGLCLVVLGGAGQAGAWGGYSYTAPWGCQAYFQSFSSGPTAQTIKQSSGSCADMFARLRTNGGSFSSWASHPSFASITVSGSWDGGEHKVCNGCTHFQT